jgi:hypothetical protein
MQPLKLRKTPEKEIQKKLIALLESRGWIVIVNHASDIFKGVPDLHICHKEYGARFVEVKVKTRYAFTPAQLKRFPLLHCNGAPVFVLTEDTEEEYNKLFKPANFPEYLRPREKKKICKYLNDDERWERDVILGEDYNG